MPYSQRACKVASNALGLKLGYHETAFAGDYTTKGCYAYADGKYAGHVFYGTGGTRKEMKATLEKSRRKRSHLDAKYRPIGYDCTTACMITVFLRNITKTLNFGDNR